jgi:hypothetical protein
MKAVNFYIFLLILFSQRLAMAEDFYWMQGSAVALSKIDGGINELRRALEKKNSGQLAIDGEIKREIGDLNAKNGELLTILKDYKSNMEMQNAQLSKSIQSTNKLLWWLTAPLTIIFLFLWSINRKLSRGIKIFSEKTVDDELGPDGGGSPLPKEPLKKWMHPFSEDGVVTPDLDLTTSSIKTEEAAARDQITLLVGEKMDGFMHPIAIRPKTLEYFVSQISHD